MALAGYVSIHLARFDVLRPAGSIDATDADALFCGVAADSRAAGTEPASQWAFRFLIFGLHATADCANRWLDSRDLRAPWLGEAVEVWSAVLQPFQRESSPCGLR
jgi:hypothetical protein